MDLRTEVWKLRKQKRQLIVANEEVVQARDMSIAGLNGGLVAARKGMDELKRQVAELHEMKKKLEMQRKVLGVVCVVLFSVVVLMWLG